MAATGGGGMHTFEETVTVAGRSPREVFAFLDDPANLPRWSATVRQAEAEGEGLERRVRATAGFLGLTFEAHQRVTAYDPPHRYAVAGEKPFPAAFDFRLEDLGQDTRVHARLEVDPGTFFPLGGRLIAGRFRKQFREDLARMCRAAEG